MQSSTLVQNSILKQQSPLKKRLAESRRGCSKSYILLDDEQDKQSDQTKCLVSSNPINNVSQKQIPGQYIDVTIDIKSEKTLLYVPKGSTLSEINQLFISKNPNLKELTYYRNNKQVKYSQTIDKSCTLVIWPKIIKIIVKKDGKKIKQVGVSKLILKRTAVDILSIIKIKPQLYENSERIFYQINGVEQTNIIYETITDIVEIIIVSKQIEQQPEQIPFQMNIRTKQTKKQLIQKLQQVQKVNQNQQKKIMLSEFYDPEFQLFKFRCRKVLNEIENKLEANDLLLQIIQDWIMYKL